jgi:hypothetical protein
MSFSNIFKPNNMIIILATIAFFMIIHTLFFRYIASNQFDSELNDKADIIKEYLKYDATTKKQFEKLKASNKFKAIEKKAKQEGTARDKINLYSMIVWTGAPVLLVILIMIAFVVILFYKNETWDEVDTILLLFVIFAYTTEIISYFSIVIKYEYYGDQEICSDIYETVKSTIDIGPVTEKGKKYYELLNKMADEIMHKYFKQNEAEISNTNVISTYFTENKQKITSMMPEITEDFFVLYMEEKIGEKSGIIDSNVLLS